MGGVRGERSVVLKSAQIAGLVIAAAIIGAAIWHYPLVFAALGCLGALRLASISGR